MREIEELKQAIRSGNLPQVEKIFATGLIQFDADLSQGYTVFSKLIPILKAIHASERDNLGYRAIHWAAREGQVAIVRFLLGKKAKVDQKNDIGNTALHVALWSGHSKVAKVLVEEGHADVNVRNVSYPELGINESFTPLHYALVYGTKEDDTLENAFFLLRNKADATARGLGETTCFHLCMHHNDPDLFAALVKACTPIERVDEDGFTFIDPGLQVDAVDDDGLTCFDRGLMDDTVTPSFLESVLKYGDFVPNIKALDFLVANADDDLVNIRARKVLLMLLYHIPLPSTTTLGLLDLMLERKNTLLINILMGVLVEAATSNTQALRAQIGLPVLSQEPVISRSAATATPTPDHSLVPRLFSPGSGALATSMPTISVALPPPPPPPPPPSILVIKARPKLRAAPKEPLAPVRTTVADMLLSNPRFAKLAEANRPKKEAGVKHADAAHDEWDAPIPGR